MVVDRYDPQDSFTHLLALTQPGDPLLAVLDRLLDDDQLFQATRAALARRHPHSLTRGRPGTPVEVLLRMLLVMRLYRWSFEETEYHVADSLTLRQFCRVYAHRVPDDTTLLRAAQLLDPQTLQQLHQRVVTLAVQAEVTRGQRLRIDTTVIATQIHSPTDSSLLTDSVRVLSRLGKQAQALLTQVGALGTLSKEAFRDRTRSMRRRGRALRQQIRGQGRRGASAAEKQTAKEQARKQLYAGLLAITRNSQRQAEQVREAVATAQAACVAAGGVVARRGRRLLTQLTEMLPKVQQVVTQAQRRTQAGETVPASEKCLSLFEDHTQVIQRGKARKAHDTVEFGRKLWLGEVEGGIVSDYAVLEQANQDATQVEARLAQHQAQFGAAPQALTGDRGLSSQANEAAAIKAGVKRVALPANGKPGAARQAQEKQRWFRQLYRWRAGIEGRISLFQRRFGLKSCPYHGEGEMERWVGWGIVTHNLRQIARAAGKN